MNPQTGKSSGTNLEGGPAGQCNASFNAHNQEYPRFDFESTGFPIRVKTPGGLKCCGHVVKVRGRWTLRKTRVDRDRHFCLRYNGYGVELAALNRAKRIVTEAVMLCFTDGRRLWAPLRAFKEHGCEDILGAFGCQSFLPLRYWHDPEAEE